MARDLDRDRGAYFRPPHPSEKQSFAPPKAAMPPEPTLEWFKAYEVRVGGDGKLGIYTRDYNCRLATFNANTAQLSTRLRLLFERANAPAVPKPKKRKRAAPRFKRTGDDARDFGFANDVGEQKGWK